MNTAKVARLVIWIALAQAAGMVGSVFTLPALPTWYASLIKPAFTPPGWLFGPVWFGLYTLIGLAAYIVWESRSTHTDRKQQLIKDALRLFGVQLVLNAVWSALFFGARQPVVAFGEILVLWMFVAATIKAFKAIKPLAALLLVPYLVWISFAALLNLGIALLN